MVSDFGLIGIIGVGGINYSLHKKKKNMIGFGFSRMYGGRRRVKRENEYDQDENYDGTKKVKQPLTPCHNPVRYRPKKKYR